MIMHIYKCLNSGYFNLSYVTNHICDINMHFVLKVIIGNFHQMYTIVFYGGGAWWKLYEFSVLLDMHWKSPFIHLDTK